MESDLGFADRTCVYCRANASGYDTVYCFNFFPLLCNLTSEAEIACVHLEQAIFVESESMLILLLPAQHCPPPVNHQCGQASETSIKNHQI